MSPPIRALRRYGWGPTAVCAGLAAALGLVQAVAAALRYSMNPDGISYIELGQAWWRGDWQAALNAYWSPLYSWLLGLALQVAEPSPRWEFPLVHTVNFLIYLAALTSFAFLWREVVRRRLGDLTAETGGSFPFWTWTVLGYALFTWASFNLIEIWSVNPDMLASAFVYLAAGLLLRADRPGGPDRGRRRIFALLGLVLGLGYLTKAALFPVALVFLAVGLAATRDLRGTALSVLVFLLVASPLVVALSWQEGRPTFSASGKLNYAWYVNGVPQLHWRGEVPGSGTPLHPTRRLSEEPPIYEFAVPVPGTYPPWYDPAYWYAGVRPHFDLREQLGALWRSAWTYSGWLLRSLGGLTALLLLLLGMNARPLDGLRELTAWWILLVPAVSGLVMYAVVYVEGRYVGGFLVLLLAGLLAGIRLPDRPQSRRLATVAGLVMSFALLADIGAYGLRNAAAFLGIEPTGNPAATGQLAAGGGAGPPWEVARELRRMGVPEGTRVGYLGRAVDDLGWARLARVRIVTETHEWPTLAFWSDPEAEGTAIQGLLAAGAEAIVAADVPPDAVHDWRRIGDTSHFLLTATGAGGPGRRKSPRAAEAAQRPS